MSDNRLLFCVTCNTCHLLAFSTYATMSIVCQGLSAVIHNQRLISFGWWNSNNNNNNKRSLFTITL